MRLRSVGVSSRDASWYAPFELPEVALRAARLPLDARLVRVDDVVNQDALVFRFEHRSFPEIRQFDVIDITGVELPIPPLERAKLLTANALSAIM